MLRFNGLFRTSTTAAGSMLLSLISTIVNVAPLPWNYANFIKLPTAAACVLIIVLGYGPSSARWRNALLIGFVSSLVAYLLLAIFFLHTDSQMFDANQYAAIGLWPTPWALRVMHAKHWSAETLQLHHGPSDWDSLYDTSSQVATSLLLFFVYFTMFVSLTLAVGHSPRTPSGKSGSTVAPSQTIRSQRSP